MAKATGWTNKQIAALELPAGKTEQRVLVEPGLYLYMRQRAAGDIAKQWQHRSQVEGVRRWVSLGAFPAVGLAKARSEALPHRSPREARQDRPGRRPASAVRKTAPRAQPTVAATFAEWMADQRSGSARQRAQPVRERTLQALTQHFSLQLLPVLGRLKINQVTTEALRSCVEGRPDGTDTRTAAQAYRTLRGLLAFAVARGYVTGGNPMRGIEKPAQGPRASVANVAGDADILTLLNAIDDSRLWPATKMAIELPLFTGARPTEVRLATWSEFDLARSAWTIPAGRVKGGREFQLHLSPQAVALLERARSHQERTGTDGPAASAEFVFKGAKGQAMEKMAVTRALARLAKRTESQGGKKLAPRDLRGSFQALLERLGTHPQVAEACMNQPALEGGTSPQGLAPGPSAEMVEAWDKVGAHIAGLRSGKVTVLAGQPPTPTQLH